MLGWKDPQIQLAIGLKLHQLQREELATLRYENLVETLRYGKWRKEIPYRLYEAVHDIYSLSADEIVRMLLSRAPIEAAQHQLTDYEDLWKGVKND